MNLRFGATLFLTTILLGSPSVFAATGSNTLQELERRVIALERQAGAKKPIFTGFGEHQLGVLLQVQAVHDETAGVNDTFKGRRAEIGLSGSLIPKRVTYKLMIDPFLSGNITKDAYMTFSYVRYADVQFGQFKFPQGLEGRWPAADLDFAERAIISSQFGDKRDYTAQLGGSQIPVGPVTGEYALAFVNGSGQNAVENNSHKDFAGRAGMQAGWLWLGASGYLGLEPTGQRTRAGGEFRIAAGPWKLQAEYLRGLTEPGVPGDSLAQEGYYVLANYVWGCLRPGIRWESWNSNKDLADNRLDALTGGVDFLLTKDRKNKLTLNYTAKFEAGTAIANDQAIAQLQVAF